MGSQWVDMPTSATALSSHAGREYRRQADKYDRQKAGFPHVFLPQYRPVRTLTNSGSAHTSPARLSLTSTPRIKEALSLKQLPRRLKIDAKSFLSVQSLKEK